MLITRQGFRAFNEYELSAILNAQIKKLQGEVAAMVKNGDTSQIVNIPEKYKISPLVFSPEKITLSVESAQIPAEYFPHSYWVEPGERYVKDVLQFHLPFTGDKQLLRCVPSPRIIQTEQIDIVRDEIIFEVIKFSDDVNFVTNEKDRVIKFLQAQSQYLNTQIEQYNNNIDKVIGETQQKTITETSKDEDFLRQLGIPKKEKPTKLEKVTNPPSHIIEKELMEYDVFISHASEDKEFVNKLAEALKKTGFSVWYDSFVVGWGDDLRPTIDNGLKNSRYGLVIFSKAFLDKKPWTEYELNGLFSREKNGRKVILPIWHNITRDDISQYSPTFADRIAKKSDNIDDIVNDLKKLLVK